MIRIFVKRKEKFNLEEKQLNHLFGSIHKLSSYKQINFYLYYEIDAKSATFLKPFYEQIFYKKATDILVNFNVNKKNYFAVESLPLQFNQRSQSCEDLIYLLTNKKIKVKTGLIYEYPKEINETDLAIIKKHLINPIENYERNFKQTLNYENPKFINTLKEDFINLDSEQLRDFYQNNSYAFSFEDLKEIQKYFISIKRNPTISELTFLDIYWSDHCRHTTFNTCISEIKNLNIANKAIQETYKDFLQTKKILNITEETTLMQLATINAKWEKYRDNLKDVEFTEENNACTLVRNIDDFYYYLTFKNETHNHPTEIEPYGGAATCLGGAIRDIMSARTYAFAGIRISGCANILEPLENTLENKLAQSYIAENATKGFSSYGNQIGLATAFVDEIYDDSFVAKHFECGAVLGYAPKEYVNKQKPVKGDLIILAGGKTGIDGIGGATGSSKSGNENTKSLLNEVQKANPIVARNLQRLIRQNKEFCQMIKKSNDFGAGGASVAIGEIADGVDLYLDKFFLKYKNITPFQILFSESQERMGFVIDKKNKSQFLQMCKNENILAAVIGEVTDLNKFRVFHKQENLLCIDREFLNSNGALRKIKIDISSNHLENYSLHDENDYENNLNNAFKKGLVEFFDHSIGRGSIQNAFGGKHLLTKTDCAIQQIPFSNETYQQAAIVACGYNLNFSKSNFFQMGEFSVIETITKLVIRGTELNSIRFSLQEYFAKLNTEKKWAQPFLSLLGAYKVMKFFNLAAIGGKDSMSGSYKDIDVNPVLLSFGFSTIKPENYISNVFINKPSYFYLFSLKHNHERYPDLESLKNNFKLFYKYKNQIIASCTNSNSSLWISFINSCQGNKVGVDLIKDFRNELIGSFIIQTENKIEELKNHLIGQTNNSQKIIFQQQNFDLANILQLQKTKYEKVYPISEFDLKNRFESFRYHPHKFIYPYQVEKLKILYLLTEGTNCEFDIRNAFEEIDKNNLTHHFFVLAHETKSLSEITQKFLEEIKDTHIFVIPGGFSMADEPDGSAKFIAAFLNYPEIKKALKRHIEEKKLIMGICNGFQALINAGLLVEDEYKNKITLHHNFSLKHVSNLVTTTIICNNSPFLRSFDRVEEFTIPVSHGEGRLVCDDLTYLELVKKNQVFSIYSNPKTSINNLNGSYFNIEGMVSENGLILGKMGHDERVFSGSFKNANLHIKRSKIFENAINYFFNK